MSERRGIDTNLWEAMGKVGFDSGASVESQPSPASEDSELYAHLDAGTLEGHPYYTFLQTLEKPGRYTGGELYSIRKEKVGISIALAFPDTYEIGMSHLGFKILYSDLNDREDFRAERVYAPWFDLERELRQRGLPLVTLESWSPLSEFDCVGFSFQYELTYTNVLNMLDLGGVPLRTADRSEEDPLACMREGAMPRKATPPWARVNVQLPAAILRQLDALAKSRLVPRSGILREALLAYIKGLKR